ncbi:MAG TPA: WGR and DUF4132 domain-containing protein [Herpetosiphonaceae bacterium]
MTTREFHYQEASSSKFWRIARDGSTCTVQFGKIGSAGQTQTKTYADEQAAQAAYTKQIAEKVKKGYREVAAQDRSEAAAPAVAQQVESAAPQAQKTRPAPAETAPLATLSEPAVFDITPRLDLDPTDWFWASWRNLPPLVRPAPAPFDKADALRRLARVSKSVYHWGWSWEKYIPAVPSAQEATFWLHAMQPLSGVRYYTSAEVAAALADGDFSNPVSCEQAIALVCAAPQNARTATMALLAALCSPQEIVEWLIQTTYDASQQHTAWSAIRNLLGGFRHYVLPYLDQAERQRLSRLLVPHLDLTEWPDDMYQSGPSAFYLAAMLGGHSDLLLRLVEGWADDRYGGESWTDYYQRPQAIIFGLDDPLLVAAQMRRLQLRLNKSEQIRAWLTHTEFSALDVVGSTIQSQANRDEAAALLQTLALAVAPEVAPVMLALQQSSKAPQIARAWLEEHPAHAIAGLLPLADGHGLQAEAAVDLLQRFARHGYEALIDEALARMPEDVVARLRAAVIDSSQPQQVPFDDQTTPGWLSEALQAQPSLRSVKLPDWAHPSDLPPVIVGQHTLSATQADALLRALQRSKLDAPHPLVVALKQHAAQSALDSFAWSLFDLWRSNGAPSKENWAFFALGWLGGDTTALKLAPLIRIWPGESQHQRAVNGLECLRLIGSDTALMQINGIAQKVKFKGLQQRAAECMERIATDRGLSRAQLEDRIVPDCDLDARGERVFDFGPRQFRFVLGPEMKPMVRDPQGKLKPTPPAPNAKDDAEKAAQAVADWKLLKKQVAEVAGVQAVRLEQAMVTGRRWSRAEFETLLVRHPLMTHLVRTLIWGAFDAAGALSATFRVTEDQTYADPADDTFDLAPDASVGIVHPLHLPAEARAAWGEILSDYEIVQPFPQLGRPIQRLEPDELPKTEITRFNALTISAAALVFGLDKLGWVRDMPADGGGFSGHSKPFDQANLTAVVQYREGVAVGWIVDAPDQQIEYVAFVPGIRAPEYWPNYNDRLPLTEIDPVVLSEVLNDMLVLAAKAK